ncbi:MULTISPECIES: S1-like domain-containing RNA-binding protein [Exiguobacterium]|uniref:DNA-binding protein n=1 Tax=Exiguobacterium oxidotolerans TaxID=223958 RepID=A0A653I3G0_9BACL|nr:MULTISPECIES: S1-like domain-containing RNA-binding protein [Exiguobacterium]ASI34590.1 DNA-binding protein [Exiguobacterium sp. N4-1P]VWX33304.1 DNA-binding protein [Exiguobacterium oxidotolerans]
MALRAGQVVTLKVEREAEFGVFLSDGTEDILLHKNEQTKSLMLEEEVEVFLYQDNEGRLASSMTIPEASFEDYVKAPINGTRYNTGVFANIGIQKDVLVSLDDLPQRRTFWPEEGDELYIRLKHDQKLRLLGDPAPYAYFNLKAQPAPEEWNNMDVEGLVFAQRDPGVNVWVNDQSIGFLHEQEMERWPRLGEVMKLRVTNVKPDGTVLLSARPRAHEAIDIDADLILNHLLEHGGQMAYGDKTPPETIDEVFGLSKAAFKRALGRLLKDKKIEKHETGIRLTK